MSGKPTRALFVCNDADVPRTLRREAWTVQKALWSHGPSKNLELYGENLGRTVLKEITDRVLDLVRIASYVYVADQEVSRGGLHDAYGEGWHRRMVLCLDVIPFLPDGIVKYRKRGTRQGRCVGDGS